VFARERAAQPATERIDAMSDNSLDLEPTDEEILTDDISDEALEAAAGMGATPQGLPCTAAPFLANTFGAGKC
jgi:hypothetical protein